MKSSKSLKFLMVFDKFKDTLSANSVCTAISSHLLQSFPTATLNQVPISDGGDGFLDCMYQILLSKQGNVRRVSVSVRDPLMRAGV